MLWMYPMLKLNMIVKGEIVPTDIITYRMSLGKASVAHRLFHD